MWSTLINQKHYWRLIPFAIFLYAFLYVIPKLVLFYPTAGSGEFFINAGHYLTTTFLSTLLLGIPFLIFGLFRSKLKYDLVLLIPCFFLSALFFFWRKYGFFDSERTASESVGDKDLQINGEITSFAYWQSFENTLFFFAFFVALIYILIILSWLWLKEKIKDPDVLQGKT